MRVRWAAKNSSDARVRVRFFLMCYSISQDGSGIRQSVAVAFGDAFLYVLSAGYHSQSMSAQ